MVPSRWVRIAAYMSLGLALTCVTAGAQKFSAPPINVSNNLDQSATPQIALDAAGNINVVWEDDIPNTSKSNILFRRSTNGGMTFSTPQIISKGLEFSFNPRICVDVNGAINVVWVDYTSGNSDIFFRRSSDGGANFSDPQNLSNDAADNANPQVSVDAAGNISVVWENDDITFGVFYTHSTDGGATFYGSTPSTPPRNLAANPDGSFEPQIVIDAGGNINVVWEDDVRLPSGAFQSDIFFARSTDNGLNFSAATNLSINSGNSVSAQLAVDATGNINVAWIDSTPGNPQILFSRSVDNGTTFSASKSVANIPGSSGNPKIAVDGSGNIYVVWQDNTPPAFSRDIFFARSSDGGVTFSFRNLSVNLGNSMNPSLAIDPAGNVNVSWQSKLGTDSEIFFKQSVDAGGTFPSLLNPSNKLGSSADVQIAAGQNGNLDVVFDDSASGVTQIFFSRFSNNQPPVANAGPNQTLQAAAPAGTPVTLDGSASSDPDGDALTFQWKDENNNVVGNSAIVSLTVAKGVHTFTLTVTDTGGLSSSAVTHVTILDQPPVAKAGPDQTLQAASPAGTPVTLDGSASSDPDGDALTFQWKDENNNVVGNAAIVSLTVAKGMHTFTLTVTDTGGLSSSAVTHVTILDQPPVAKAGPDQTLQAASPAGTPVTLNGSASSDPDGDALTFQWKDENNNVVGNAAIVSLTVAKGVHTFTLTVTDTGGLSSSAVTHVTILDQPPVAKAGPDQTLQSAGPAGTPVTLNGSASSDPDGDALTFQWKDENNNVVGNAAIVQLTLTIGVHTFTLTVTDPGGLSSTAVTHVTITKVNRPPVANAGPDQILQCVGPAGMPVTLNGSASSDPDGDALRFVWTDENNHVVGTSAVVQVAVFTLGTHTFMLTVTDTGGLSSTASTHVTLGDTQPPTLSFSLSPNALYPPNHKLVLVTATVTASDVCDAHPSVRLVSITSTDPTAGRDADIEAADGGPVAFGTDVRSFQLRSENSDQGGELVYTVTYSSSDASGNTAWASAQVPVGHNYTIGPLRTNPLKKGDKDKHSDDRGRRKKER